MSVSTVIASIQDPSGQLFANGTWQLVFKPTPNTPGPFTDGGVAFTTIYGGALDSSGSLSQINVNRNDTIAPAGSRWTLTVSPNANGQAYSVDLNVNNGAFNASAAINAIVTNVVVNATNLARAYKDVEVVPAPGSGGTYFDVTRKTLKVYDPTTTSWLEFDPASLEVLLNPAGAQTIVQPIGTDLNINRLEDIRFADQFAGGNVSAQIDAALADFGVSSGLLVIPSSMGAGNSVVGIPDNVRVLDLRGLSGPDQVGQEAVAYLKDIILRARWTTAPNAVQNYEVLHLHGEPFHGGFNGAFKTNYSCLVNTMDARTRGQHTGITQQLANFSNGDVVGVVSDVYSMGGSGTGGDEGCEGFTVQANQSLQTIGIGLFTGTVTANTAGVLTFSITTNINTLGEDRPVIITTGAKVYSTGTVSGIAGTPPIVTGVGTNWAVQFGTGVKTNLFFALDADVNGIYKYLVPVRSITDATHLVLDLISEGVDTAYPTANTGTYKIYKGGVVTALTADLTGVTVSPSADFASTDTVEQVLAYSAQICGGHITVSAVTPSPANQLYQGLLIDNISPLLTRDTPIHRGLGFHSFGTGSFNTGVMFDTPLNVDAFEFPKAVGVGGTGPIISHLDLTSTTIVNIIRMLTTGGGAARFFTYDRANDQWTLGNNFNSSGLDGRIALGTTVVASNAFFLSYSNVAWNGLQISGAATQNNGVFPFQVNAGGVPMFYTQNAGGGTAYVTAVNNSTPLIFFSGNQVTETARIASATGLAEFKRLKIDKGTAYTAADGAIVLSAGWGTTRTVSAATGFDQALSFNVNATGTGQAASPTITITFKDGTFTTAPQAIVLRNDLVTPFNTPPHTIAITATTLTITFNGTPTAANVYSFIVHLIGV